MDKLTLDDIEKTCVELTINFDKRLQFVGNDVDNDTFTFQYTGGFVPYQNGSFLRPDAGTKCTYTIHVKRSEIVDNVLSLKFGLTEDARTNPELTLPEFSQMSLTVLNQKGVKLTIPDALAESALCYLPEDAADSSFIKVDGTVSMTVNGMKQDLPVDPVYAQLRKGHSFTNYVSNGDATCTEDGTETAVCDRTGCNATDTRTDVDSHLGHDLGEWETVTSPDCTNKGSQKRECSRCDYVETKDIDHNGHEWKDDFTTDKEATCTTDGSKSIHCKNCEAVKDNTVIPATGHSYDDSWKSDENNHWQECIACGDESEVSAHDFEWIIDKEATETEKGSKHEECSVCGYKKDAVEIPAAGKPGDNTTGGDNENPSKPSDPNTEAPQTGDNSNLWIWIVLMAIFAAGAGSTLLISKKRGAHAKTR